MKKVLPPLVDFAIPGTTKSLEFFCDLREQVGLQRDKILVRNAREKPFGAL